MLWAINRGVIHHLTLTALYANLASTNWFPTPFTFESSFSCMVVLSIAFKFMIKKIFIDFHSHVEWHNSYFILTIDENIYFNFWVLTILVLFLKKTHSGKWVCLVVYLVDMLVRVVRCHPLYRYYGLPKKRKYGTEFCRLDTCF